MVAGILPSSMDMEICVDCARQMELELTDTSET